MQRWISRAAGIMLLVAALTGCGNRGLDLTIRFDRIDGLRTDDPVLHDESPIGKVTGIAYREEGAFLVDIVIEPDFTDLATEHSRFFVMNRPEAPDRGAVGMIRVQEGGSPLADGASLNGISRHSALFERFGRDVEARVAELARQVEDFLGGLSTLSESEQAKRLEAELDRLLQDLQTMGEGPRETLAREVLPRIREEIERLREALNRLGRDDEMESIEQKMRRLEGATSV
ncbi:MAG: hypothetical protein ACOWWM_13875 [Desulfobacterales bacterium]